MASVDLSRSPPNGCEGNTNPMPGPERQYDPQSPRSAAVWLATSFGAGLWAPAPGTAGAAIGCALAWGISCIPGYLWQIAVIVALNIAGVPLSTAAGRALGGKKDNQAIIWDEIASMPLVFLLTPLAGWKMGLLGFALHRVFDITKPPPARQLERLPDGLGVMADDWVAAAYACVALHLLARVDQWTGLALISAGSG
jgi:phosphatidylglycerophosphatase A